MQHENPNTSPIGEAARDSATGGGPARSSYGTRLGGEFPGIVYASVMIAFAWMLVASWLLFARSTESDLVLAMASILTIVMLGIPILMYRMAAARSRAPRTDADEFLHSEVETATGRLTGGQAWLQVLIIPLVVAFAATAIGIVNVLSG
jgi:predicted membrane-bound spermidine synthase